MVSVAELLNPEPPRAPLPTCRPPPPPPASPTAPRTTQPAPPPSRSSIEPAPFRMAEHTKPTSRCRAKGVINYPPFEALDEPALREVHRFQVRPFGSIQQTCERIPYNSGKKDFFSKTGREGFEVFHYEFKVPKDDAIYRVMWDYNVGLVRMTSFFKCRGYSKTTPAKMLNMNPGLKDITYSITGGSIKAQGYWMPFECAKAICATFCHEISGALTPLFGPDFPFECIPEKAPGHGRMTINPEIVARAKSEAAALFRLPPTLPSPRPSRSVSPLPSRRAGRLPERDYHSDYDRRLLLSPYTDTDVDYHPPAPDPYGRGGYKAIPMARMPTSRPPTGTGPGPVAPTPQHSPGWTAVNHPPHPHPPPPPSHIPPPHHRRAASHLHEELLSLSVSATANPWLSAVPRGGGPAGPGGPSRWPVGSPRSHHLGSRSAQPSTSPDWGPVTLPPLRMLKRPFDQVTRRAAPNPSATNIPPPDDHNHDHDHDPAYDACSSRATSTSPASLKAPPPTPLRQLSTTTTTTTPTPIRHHPGTPAAAATTTTTTAHPSPAATTTTTTTSPSATASGGTPQTLPPPPPRRESERNAAITLLHLHRREEGSVSPPSRPHNTHFPHPHPHVPQSRAGEEDRRAQAKPGAAAAAGGEEGEEEEADNSAGGAGRGLLGRAAIGEGREKGGRRGRREASPGVIHVAVELEGDGEDAGEEEEDEEEEEEGPRRGMGGRLKRRRVLGW